MDKKDLTEADIRSKFITPALVGPTGAKWNLMTQIREEVSMLLRCARLADKACGFAGFAFAALYSAAN